MSIQNKARSESKVFYGLRLSDGLNGRIIRGLLEQVSVAVSASHKYEIIVYFIRFPET